MTDRGVDGLTADELKRGRQTWWEPGLTRAFVEALPSDAKRIVEVGCGTGHLGAQLLSITMDVEYVGVDLDRARTVQAQTALREGRDGGRARFLAGRAEALPFATGSVDAALTCMTLMHLPAPALGLAEVLRVLRPGGVVITAEPDNLSQRWYFDGMLEGVTAAFADLYREARRRRLPADLAIGPRVASLLRAAGFADVTVRVYASFTSRPDTPEKFAESWRWVLGLVASAGAFPDTDPLVAACDHAIAAWLAAAPPGLGQGGDTVPTFITVGRKPAST